mmetsp:Transcript_10394/g.12618  ORF Transcript_10394/g.12618 Transcript_10394/m.12618 type:complete len:84 (+) Transcript_10394:1035-1286(+)
MTMEYSKKLEIKKNKKKEKRKRLKEGKRKYHKHPPLVFGFWRKEAYKNISTLKKVKSQRTVTKKERRGKRERGPRLFTFMFFN